MSFIPSAIKSVQRFTITITGFNTSGTQAISAVNLATSAITGFSYHIESDDAGGITLQRPKIILTSNVLVTVNRAAPGGSVGATTTVSFEVTEYQPAFIRSIQPFSLVFTGTEATKTTPLTALIMNKTKLFYHGAYQSGATTTGGDVNGNFDIVLTSTVLVTATRCTNPTTGKGGWTVGGVAVEFK